MRTKRRTRPHSYHNYSDPWNVGLLLWVYDELHFWCPKFLGSRLAEPTIFTSRVEWIVQHKQNCKTNPPLKTNEWVRGEVCIACNSIFLNLAKHATRAEIRDTLVHELYHLALGLTTNTDIGEEEHTQVMTYLILSNGKRALPPLKPVYRT